jgi:hypothetical protein
MVSAAGGKAGYVAASQHDVYRALRRKGYSKTKSAKIANSKARRRGRARRARRGR